MRLSAALIVAAFLAGGDAHAVTCGETVTASVTLDGDLDCPGDGLLIGADAVTIDCAGHAIRAATPGKADLRAADHSKIEIRDCRLGGWFGIQADRVDGLTIVDNEFAGLAQPAISVRDAAHVTVLGNVLRSDLNWISVWRSGSTRIEGNRLESAARGSFINASGTPGPEIQRNAIDGVGGIGIMDAEGGRIEQNTLRGKFSQLSALRTTGSAVADNRLLREASGASGTATITLLDAARCTIVHNVLSAGGGSGVVVYGTAPDRGENLIAQNDVRGGSYAVVLLDPRSERVESNSFRDQAVAIVAYSDPGAPAAGAPADLGAAIVSNRIEGATIGIAAFEIGGLLIKNNLIRNNEVGVYELDATPPVAQPNRYERNRIAGNRGFGMAILGTSPVIVGNLFTGNGGAAELSEDVSPLPWLLGETRAAIAIAPFSGFGNDVFDDGVPDNDAVPAPTIGTPREPNVFRDNDRVDVYALDARPANSPSLAMVNRFLGCEARFQQDWFGLARVLDGTGSPVSGAAVRFVDAGGRTVLETVSGDDGYAPANTDPLRPQGVLEADPGGPVPHWPIFNERLVDGHGRVRMGTPHTIRARSSFDRGCSWYAWNGHDDVGETGSSVQGRYQTAAVTLGGICPLGLVQPAPAGWGVNLEP